MLEFFIKFAPIVGAVATVGMLIFHLLKILLRPKPDLLLGFMNENPEQDLLTSFKLMIQNNGKKSAEEVTIWLQTHKRSGIEIRPMSNRVEITDRDSLWKGVIFEYPAWDGPEHFWRLVHNSVHPHQGIPIGQVLVHPDWPGWEDQKWTFIKWNIFTKDTQRSSGKIHIPIRDTGSGLWATRN
jgi:hypothetical protein